MSSLIQFDPIPRAPGVSRRAVVLGFGGRFTDELLSGLPAVLMPTLRAHFGLTYAQIAGLDLALGYVAAVVEPGAGLLIDVWQRRWLLAWGAAGVGLSAMLMGLAPTYLFLLAAFAVYGLASGPLAHTADVVLVEAHPRAPERIFARATMLDTTGALLSPLAVTAAVWSGLSWRWLLLALGSASLMYAALLWRTHFPAPANGERAPDVSLFSSLRHNVQTALANREARRWLLFLFVLDLLEAPATFRTVWLNEAAGMNQALIGLYTALEMAVHLLSLALLDRWLAGGGTQRIRRVLQVATLALLLLIPLWLYVPGVWSRFLLALPLNFFLAMYWPVGRAQALASAPGHAGAVTAASALFGLAPLSLMFGMLAQWATLTRATLWVSLAALALMALVVRGLQAASQPDAPPSA